MTQQDDITQRVLTDEQIMRSAISACDSLNITRFHEIGAPSKTIMDDAGLLELGRAIESALLSKLRAPVADGRAAKALNRIERRASDDGRQRDIDDLAVVRAALARAPAAITELRIEFTAGGVGYVSIESARAAVLAASRASAPVADERETSLQHFCLAFETFSACAAENDGEAYAELERAYEKARATLASAPVAGEAQPVAVTDHQGDVHWRHGRKAGIALYAAPQASDTVGLLRKAAEALAGYRREMSLLRPVDIPPCDAERAIIAALKTQADKDGGQQRAGDAALARLAEPHTGMRVDYQGLLRQAREGLHDSPGLAEMLRQLQGHLRELGQRWYAGDTAVVDELLQLYCVESNARAALSANQTEQGERDA